MIEIKATILGRFDLKANGLSLLTYISNSQKSVDLLKFLLINKDKAVSVSTLIDIFWSDDGKSSNPENALKTMVSRIRMGLGKTEPVLKKCILASNRAYMWNSDIPCEVDVIEFEKACEDVRNVTVLDEKSYASFNKIMDIYTGDLAYGNVESDWLESRRAYLHYTYLQTVYRFIELLNLIDDNNYVIQICRRALEVDAFDEKLNLELMNALIKSGQNNAALTRYRQVTNSYSNYLGMEPPQEFQEFFNTIIWSNPRSETGIGEIKKELLSDDDSHDGAYVCDYSIFKDIYMLQMRNFERFECKMYLMLLTIVILNEEDNPPLVLDAAMRRLLSILKRCLRKGDTVSRFNALQYALLLPVMDLSNCYLIADRIKSQFNRCYMDHGLKLVFQFEAINDLEI